MMWVLTALLLRVHTGDLPEDGLLRMLRQSGLIFLQALPLTIFLFFFFPRYPGPIGLPLDDASTGLSDTLTPGSIAKLSQNDCRGDVRPVSKRAAIFPRPKPCTGGRWSFGTTGRVRGTPGDIADEGAPYLPQLKAKPDQVAQTVTVKAHHKRWLFALDEPVSLPINSSELITWATATNQPHRRTELSPGQARAHRALHGNLLHHACGGKRCPRCRKSGPWKLPDDPGGKDPPADQIDQENQGAGLQPARRHCGRRRREIYRLRHSLFPPQRFYLQHDAGNSGSQLASPLPLHQQERVLRTLRLGFRGSHAAGRGEGAGRHRFISEPITNPYKDVYAVSQSKAHAWDEVWIADPDATPEKQARTLESGLIRPR